MKKVFIGLLIVAAGAGAFYFLQKKKTEKSNTIQKELLTGKWKFDFLKEGKDSSHSFMVGIMGMVDSNTLKYHYEFTNDGHIFRSLNDSITKDSSRYEWNKENKLVWKEDKTDTAGSILKVTKLSKDSLQIQSMDSTTVLFTKLK